jgi:hypothetical protein
MAEISVWFAIFSKLIKKLLNSKTKQKNCLCFQRKTPVTWNLHKSTIIIYQCKTNLKTGVMKLFFKHTVFRNKFKFVFINNINQTKCLFIHKTFWLLQAMLKLLLNPPPLQPNYPQKPIHPTSSFTTFSLLFKYKY